jgi:3-dehydroquinate dehydratase-2
MFKFLVIHGPNLNMLGEREPDIYGHQTLDDVDHDLSAIAESQGFSLESFQSNHEGDLIDRIQQAWREEVHYLIINPAGLTHTSVALRDAVLAANIDFTEVHLSDPRQRESFRHISLFEDIARETIVGKGVSGYFEALNNAIERLEEEAG